MIYTTIYRCLRASTLVVLNRNIAIFITTKYQNVPYNGRAKAIFFGSAATVFFYLCIHTAFNYFSFLFFLLFLFLFFCVHIDIVCAFTLLLLIFFLFLFLYSSVNAIYCLCVHTAIVLLFLYFFLFLYIVFFFCSHYYCSKYIILL